MNTIETSKNQTEREEQQEPTISSATKEVTEDERSLHVINLEENTYTVRFPKKPVITSIPQKDRLAFQALIKKEKKSNEAERNVEEAAKEAIIAAQGKGYAVETIGPSAQVAELIQIAEAGGGEKLDLRGIYFDSSSIEDIASQINEKLPNLRSIVLPAQAEMKSLSEGLLDQLTMTKDNATKRTPVYHATDDEENKEELIALTSALMPQGVEQRPAAAQDQGLKRGAQTDSGAQIKRNKSMRF
ncbi:MAG: hypothetical protein AAGB24_09820 [Bacteroidota bacterium]